MVRARFAAVSLASCAAIFLSACGGPPAEPEAQPADTQGDEPALCPSGDAADEVVGLWLDARAATADFTAEADELFALQDRVAEVQDADLEARPCTGVKEVGVFSGQLDDLVEIVEESSSWSNSHPELSDQLELVVSSGTTWLSTVGSDVDLSALEDPDRVDDREMLDAARDVFDQKAAECEGHGPWECTLHEISDNDDPEDRTLLVTTLFGGEEPVGGGLYYDGAAEEEMTEWVRSWDIEGLDAVELTQMADSSDEVYATIEIS